VTGDSEAASPTQRRGPGSDQYVSGSFMRRGRVKLPRVPGAGRPQSAASFRALPDVRQMQTNCGLWGPRR